MSAHTPGPWRVADDVVFQVRAHDDRMLVAEVRGWGWLTGVGGLAMLHDDAEQIQRANAHLIAAAPDLLAALEAWQSLRFECVEDGSPAPRDGCECSVCDTSRESATAIARAEGKR